MEDDPPTGPSQDILGERITFVVPSSSDFERITGFKNFTALWSVGGNTFGGASSGNAVGGVGGGGHSSVSLSDGYGLSAGDGGSDSDTNGLHSLFAKLSNGNAEDFHQILNYLWIGAVVALVVLSLIFIVFSFYFYRKFVEWKKCNKDIQSQIPNDLQQPYGAEDVYCKIESPPCYTIATGLPTYSEALLLYSQQYEHQLGYLWLPSLWNHHSQQGELQQRQPENIKATASEPVSREDDNFAGCSGLSVVGGNLGLPTKDSDNGHRMPGTTGSVREVTIPSQSLESGNILTEVVVAS